MELTIQESDPILRTEEALMTDVILTNLFSLLPVPELKICRMVCQRWNLFARTFLSKNSCVKIGVTTPELNYPWMSPDGEMSSTVTDGDVENWRKAKEFIEFLNTRDTDIAVSYVNLRVRASLIAQFAGVLLLHPFLREGITALDILVYPSQLEWLKTIIPELKNLKKVDVRVGGSDRYRILYPTPPPPNFPEKYLGFDGEVPPALSVPEDYIVNGHEDQEPDFSIETLNFKCFHHVHPRQFGTDVQEFLQTCVTGTDTCFSSWIIHRSPKLENLQVTSQVITKFPEMLKHFSRTYRGKGFKSLIFDTRYYANGAGTCETTRELLEFFKICCIRTLETLCLFGTQIHHLQMLSSPHFPRETLTALGMDLEVELQDTDFNWKLDENIGYTLTPKKDRWEETDFLQHIPLIHNLIALRYLTISIKFIFQRTADNKDVDQNEINSSIQATALGNTSRLFPNLYKLDIESQTFGQRGNRMAGSICVNLAPDLGRAFPALKILTIESLPPAWLNKGLLSIPPRLERLGIYITYAQHPAVTDEYFLDNGALLRFTELREFFLSSEELSLTDAIIYDGFLKLPKLSYLNLPLRKGQSVFGEAALKELELKPCFFPKNTKGEH